MESIVTFLSDNYMWFLIITLILIFALIGYLVDVKEDERFTKKVSLDKELTSKVEAATAVNITLKDMALDSAKKSIESDISSISNHNNINEIDKGI